MILSAHRKQKIYLAAIMEYQLGSDDPDEIAYYIKIKTEMGKDKNGKHMGIPRAD